MVIKSLLVGGWLMAAMAAAEPSSRAEPMVALLCPRPGEPANNLYHNKFLRDINHDNQCFEGPCRTNFYYTKVPVARVMLMSYAAGE